MVRDCGTLCQPTALSYLWGGCDQPHAAQAVQPGRPGNLGATSRVNGLCDFRRLCGNASGLGQRLAQVVAS